MKPDFSRAGEITATTTDDTRTVGLHLGQYVQAGTLVILDGPLGAGKTTFTQGIAEGLRVQGRVTSPTFIIAREHPPQGDGPALIHVDAYRLLGEGSSGDPLGELDALDLDTALEDSVVVAEWGGGLVEQITQEYLFITLDRHTAIAQDPDSEARIISWQWKNNA